MRVLGRLGAGVNKKLFGAQHQIRTRIRARGYTHYRVQGMIGFAQLVSFLSISTIISLIPIFLSLIWKISTLCRMVVYFSVQGMPIFQLVLFLIKVRNAIILTGCNTILYKEWLFWTSLFLMP